MFHLMQFRTLIQMVTRCIASIKCFITPLSKGTPMSDIQPAVVKRVRKPGAGRPRLFDDKTIQYIRDNPDQLVYSELAQKFSCSIQTIRRCIRGTKGYNNV
jgi:hypothetical protein